MLLSRPPLRCYTGAAEGRDLSTDAKEERLSRRAVLALPLLPLALPPAKAAAAEGGAEILLVDGWVLRRADLSAL